jgi:hypothetical protein
MDSCFDSCKGTRDTRYPSLSARFVRLRQTGIRSSDIKLFELYAYQLNDSDVLIRHNIVTKFCKNVISAAFSSDNLNASGSNPAGATGANAYIQIDLENEVSIDAISLRKIAGSNLAGTQLICMLENGDVSFYKDIDDTDFVNNEFRFQTGLNPLRETVTIVEIFPYPEGTTYTDGYSNNKPKLLFHYDLSSSLSAIVINTICTNTNLTSLSANTMSITDADNLFISTSSEHDTRFPNPEGKYVRIQGMTGTSGFIINNIILTDDKGDIITPILNYQVKLIQLIGYHYQ